MKKFIVIEGLDGSGKTTVSKLLQKRFINNGLPCYHTYEPTHKPIGKQIRSFLTGKDERAPYEAMALLFAADRIEHIHNEIAPNLMHNYVVCDRYYYSNMAYQSYNDQSLDFVVYCNKPAMKLCPPDITFFLNITPEECMRRIENRGEIKSIYETTNELERIYKQFMSAIERMKETDNIVLVGTDAASPDEIVKEMWEHLSNDINKDENE